MLLCGARTQTVEQAVVNVLTNLLFRRENDAASNSVSTKCFVSFTKVTVRYYYFLYKKAHNRNYWDKRSVTRKSQQIRL